MSEQDTTQSNQAEQKNGCCHSRHNSNQHCHGKHRIGRFIGLLAILGIGFMAGKSFGSEHGWCHEVAPDFISGKPIAADQVGKMAEKRVQHMLAKLDASKEQQAKANEIVKKSVASGVPLAEQMRAGHQKILALLNAKVIDRAAIEQLRLENLKSIDELSKLLTQTMLDIAEVLTPEQRAKMSEIMSKHSD